MDTIIENYDIELYLKSLSPKEFKAYLIAKNHLGMTFDIEKSIGFIKWLINRTKQSNII